MLKLIKFLTNSSFLRNKIKLLNRLNYKTTCSINVLGLPSMYRRRFPLETAVKRPPEPFSNANAYKSLEHKYPSHYPNFLSHQSTHLLHSTYNAHLRTVAELAFGSAATFSQAQKELFRIVEAAERGEGRLRNPRLLHHASQAWNLEFFLRGLVSEVIIMWEFNFTCFRLVKRLLRLIQF